MPGTSAAFAASPNPQTQPNRADRERELEAALLTTPGDVDAWRDIVAIAIDDGRLAIAVQRFRRAMQHVRPTPEMHYLAARALAGQSLWLGKPEVRVIQDGRMGQFSGDWLPIEKLDGLDKFRCVPADSALYQVRRALDAGFDQFESHMLHARAWIAAGDPATAWRIVESQKTRLDEARDERLLGDATNIAAASNHIAEALRFAQARAELVERGSQERDAILFDAYVRCADRCGLAGDDALYRDLLTRAAELHPKDALIGLRIADAEYEAGNRSRAREWYRRVIDLDPNHAARARVLQRLAE